MSTNVYKPVPSSVAVNASVVKNWKDPFSLDPVNTLSTGSTYVWALFATPARFNDAVNFTWADVADLTLIMILAK